MVFKFFICPSSNNNVGLLNYVGCVTLDYGAIVTRPWSSMLSVFSHKRAEAKQHVITETKSIITWNNNSKMITVCILTAYTNVTETSIKSITLSALSIIYHYLIFCLCISSFNFFYFSHQRLLESQCSRPRNRILKKQ